MTTRASLISLFLPLRSVLSPTIFLLLMVFRVWVFCFSFLIGALR